jgi:uncharacterized protein YceH (UPF0502 family)
MKRRSRVNNSLAQRSDRDPAVRKASLETSTGQRQTPYCAVLSSEDADDRESSPCQAFGERRGETDLAKRIEQAWPILDQIAGNDHAMDFGCAVDDTVKPRVPVEFLDQQVFGIS